MKLFFANSSDTGLADKNSALLAKIKEALLSFDAVYDVRRPEIADAIIFQEINSFKDFRYINMLLNDSLIAKYLDKVYTINTDDCATGLLRGLYTSMPKSRFNPRIYASVPYIEYPNQQVFAKSGTEVEPKYLASWRGNTKSNKIRPRLVSLFSTNQDIQIETTESWLNHQQDEKKAYVALIKNAKFSLCPAGWASVSFRIYESMALGRCPVIIADNFVPPEGPDWHAFALFVPESRLNGLYSYLLQNEHRYRLLGEKAYQAWERFFSPSVITNYYASSLLSLMQAAPKCSKENELKRWKSSSFFWSNGWTIPQRVVNKFRRLTQV